MSAADWSRCGPADGPAGSIVAVGYATVDQYRARTGDTATPDQEATEVLDAASRYVDRRLGWAAGALGPIPGVRTLTVWPRARGRELWLRDSQGACWPVRSWSRIRWSWGGGDTETATAPADWVAARGGDPARSLRLLGTGGPIVVWPTEPGWVEVTGTWGRAEVDPQVVELVARVAHLMLDSHAGGSAGVVDVLESAAPAGDETGRLWRRVEMELSAGRPGRLGVLANR